jgi:hypothetical protein
LTVKRLELAVKRVDKLIAQITRQNLGTASMVGWGLNSTSYLHILESEERQSLSS